MKQIGDKYVQSEFKLHKSVTNPEQIAAFMNGWEEYLENILQTARAQEYAEIVQDEKKGPTFEFGADLAPDTELSEEQKVQLEKLREEASRITKWRVSSS